MTTPEQEECTTEMVLMADIAANKFIFQVRKEALRQFQTKLIALRKERKPSTNAFAIRVLLMSCRSERRRIDFALELIEQSERFIDGTYGVSAIDELSAQGETIK
ncbi:MAG: hypothetical protein ACRC7D_17360 [Aeromonas popoffii]|uniref:hypothetical protein n=1 Tax=Aeromonas popoffii TaxID=70856 RepID=UPI003F319E6B